MSRTSWTMNCTQMKFLFHLLLLAAALNYSSQQCNKLQEDSAEAKCFCDSADDFGGWIYSCLDGNTFEVLFELKYVMDRDVTFQCGTKQPYHQTLLEQLDLTNIHTFVFKSCPLPNVSYSDLLSVYTIEQLKVESKKGDNTFFTPQLFQNISQTLKSLILTKNNIESLPESIFNNLTHLKYLALSDNRLSTLPDKIFLDLPNLILLEIANNHLEELPQNLFQGLFQLEKLYLYKNKLKRLPTGLFESLVNLKVLDLADNNLIYLPNDIFLGLAQLAHIRLRANWLEFVPKELFSYSPNLREIDLGLNRFMEPLPEEIFFRLLHLENISIHECNLTHIHESLFSYCPNITHINLQNNGLTALPQDLFKNNPALREVNLNFNAITELPANLFPNQKHLRKLFLFKNKISAIPQGFFKHTRNIQTLVLGHNSLKNASQSVFRDLPNLETVDLSSNNLTYFGLDFNEHIRQIDLSHNSLKEMPSINWIQHLKIEMINMEYNNFSFISIPVLYSTNKRNPILNFGHNHIRTVDIQEVTLNDGYIQDLPSKDYEKYVETTVSLIANPFNCDCRLFSFYDYLHRSNEVHKRTVRFSMVQNLTCHEPQELENKPIVSLNPSEFLCRITENCSSECRCYLRAQDNTRIANCSNHRLKSLPKVVPHNTKLLYFLNNNLTGMVEFNDKTWTNLTGLFLDGNQINNLDGWNIPPKLKNLSLKRNRIEQLSQNLMDFASNASRFQIALSGNPWDCNCSAMPYKTWLTEHYQIVPDVKQVMCNELLKQNGSMVRMPIVTVPDDLLCPVNEWPYKAQLISVTSICVLLALLLFIVSVLYYRNKQTVIAYVYIHMHNVFNCFFSEEDFDEDKVFDAFVSYSSSDRDVALMLMQELEDKAPHFKLCIHERNWLPGNLISWNIINSVQNSRRTILVISKAFLESMWFQVEFHTAYYQMLEDKIDRLIVIVKGELPHKETLDKDLQYLLSTKTYLVWEEKWFWEKLKYAMPHRKLQVLHSDVMALKDRPASDKIKNVENQIAILSSNGNKTSEKVQEVVQNGTSRALNYVNKETIIRK